jgi:hypothetical protein
MVLGGVGPGHAPIQGREQQGRSQGLASRIPGVEAWFFQEDGHGLPKDHIGDVHAWLVNRSS